MAEAEKATAEAALLNTETTEEPEENWYNAFQALCVSDEEESDGMDSGNDEFGLGAVSQAQFAVWLPSPSLVVASLRSLSCSRSSS